MDFHQIPNITIDEIKKAHVADERIQNKYGVKYLQFWVNEQAGNVFCLVEGPDKATCESVHKMAHGHVACAIVEVDPSYYSLIMGENVRIDQGLVQHEDGEVDPGYRSILVVTMEGKPAPKSKNLDFLKTPVKAREAVLAAFSKFKGRVVRLSGDDNLICVFNYPDDALACAKETQSRLSAANKKIKKGDHKVSFSIGLGAGQPVTISNEFIEETIRLARRLSQVAGEGQLLLSSMIREVCDEVRTNTRKKIRVLNVTEEGFLSQLFGIIDARLRDENFNIESLVHEIGISRPQLYRKIRELSGKAPNDLIRDLRLDKAMSLLRRKDGNIAEIAFKVGFSNPSYFAKCFARRFNCQPSRFVAAVAA